MNEENFLFFRFKPTFTVYPEQPQVLNGDQVVTAVKVGWGIYFIFQIITNELEVVNVQVI